jgi:hypothetical protein
MQTINSHLTALVQLSSLMLKAARLLPCGLQLQVKEAAGSEVRENVVISPDEVGSC